MYRRLDWPRWNSGREEDEKATERIKDEERFVCRWLFRVTRTTRAHALCNNSEPVVLEGNEMWQTGGIEHSNTVRKQNKRLPTLSLSLSLRWNASRWTRGNVERRSRVAPSRFHRHPNRTVSFSRREHSSFSFRNSWEYRWCRDHTVPDD